MQNQIEQMRALTDEAMKNPRKGDRFHEFFTHWVYVIKVTKKFVWTMSASAPCEFPKDAKLEKRTREKFIDYYSYHGSSLYWVDLCDRGNNVEGWLNVKRA